MRHTNYEPIAATYDGRYADEDYAGIERALIDFIGKPCRVLEVGCGTGHWLQVVQTHNINVAGVDLSWPMLSRARAKLANPYLAQARAEDLPFEGERFDRLFCINAHHHFTDKLKFFQEAYRVLTPGGSMMTIALDPHNGKDQWWVYDYLEGTLDIDKERYPACEQLRAWMGDVGFSNIYTNEVQYLPSDVAAREALQNGLVSPAHTSQLAVLIKEEFDAGLERIRAALLEDDSLRLSADLRVYATYGTRV